MRIQLTDYDAKIIRRAILECKDKHTMYLPAEIGNEYLDKLAARFQPPTLAYTRVYQEEEE